MSSQRRKDAKNGAKYPPPPHEDLEQTVISEKLDIDNNKLIDIIEYYREKESNFLKLFLGDSNRQEKGKEREGERKRQRERKGDRGKDRETQGEIERHRMRENTPTPDDESDKTGICAATGEGRNTVLVSVDRGQLAVQPVQFMYIVYILCVQEVVTHFRW